MTIEQIMKAIDRHAKAVHDGADDVCVTTRATICAFIAAIVAQARDEEAEECAGIVEACVTFGASTQSVCLDRASAIHAIRARIAARKGGGK